MGLPALIRQFETLDAATRSNRIPAPQPAEILTFSRARVIKPVNSLIDSTNRIRVLFIQACKDIPDIMSIADDDFDLKSAPRFLILYDDLVFKIDTWRMTHENGQPVIEWLEEVATKWAKNSADDGRFMRRLVNRLRKAEAAVNGPRHKLLKIFADMRPSVVEWVYESEQKVLEDRNRYNGILAKQLKKYPIITSALAG